MSNSPIKRCSYCEQEFPDTTICFYANITNKDGTKGCQSHPAKSRVKYPPVQPGNKRCFACKQELPATTEFFSVHKRNADGWYYLCKQCNNGARRVPVSIDAIPDGHKRCSICKNVKPKTLEYFSFDHSKSRWIARCKECGLNERRGRNYQVDPQITSKRCTKCHLKYPATCEYFSKRKANKDGWEHWCKSCHRAVALPSRIRNKEKINKRSKAWKDAHPESAQVYTNRRRSHKLQAQGTFTAQDIDKQYANQKGKCYYCKIKVARNACHIDHIVPLSKGGSNDPSNLVITCPPCNLSKHDKLPHQWYQGGILL